MDEQNFYKGGVKSLNYSRWCLYTPTFTNLVFKTCISNLLCTHSLVLRADSKVAILQQLAGDSVAPDAKHRTKQVWQVGLECHNWRGALLCQ